MVNENITDNIGVTEENLDLNLSGNNPYINQSNNGDVASSDRESITGLSTADFVKGALIGAGATWLVTNEKVQRAVFKSIVRIGGMFQGGIEELKEQYEDAQAEVTAEKMTNND